MPRVLEAIGAADDHDGGLCLYCCPIFRKLQGAKAHFRFQPMRSTFRDLDSTLGTCLLCHFEAKAEHRLVQREWLQKV